MLASVAGAAEVNVQSGPARTHLLELYTSEGCSSCPPAERWFSGLKQNSQLWKEVVPIAFHVDSWNQLGWRDRFASAANTARQRSYATAWGSHAVYTPGFVLDGREWRAGDLDAMPSSSMNVGMLTATLRDSGETFITFLPAETGTGPWEAHAALLGFGLKSDVRAGENRGRMLLHDFVVLAHEATVMMGSRDDFRASLQLPPRRASGAAYGLAVWVNQAGKLEPVQAAGGEL